MFKTEFIYSRGQDTWHLQAAPPVRVETVFGRSSLLPVAPSGGAMCFVPICIYADVVFRKNELNAPTDKTEHP